MSDSFPRLVPRQAKSARSWFPGQRFVPLRQITGAEVLSDQHRVAVQVSKTTIHGSSSQMLLTGLAMVRAAIAANPELAVRLRAEAPGLARSI